MREILKIVLILLVLLITACGSGEDEGEENTSQNPAPGNPYGPQLMTIGSRVLLSGDPLTINLSSTNPNGGSLTWTADGTVGPNANPLLAGATFDELAGQFSWSDTSMDMGTYNIRFTVTDDAVPPQSDSETISIVIMDIFSYGQSSYNSYCASCHGDEGIGGDEQILQCIEEADLAFGMGRAPMSGIGNSWDNYDREFDAILYYLRNVQPLNCL